MRNAPYKVNRSFYTMNHIWRTTPQLRWYSGSWREKGRGMRSRRRSKGHNRDVLGRVWLWGTLFASPLTGLWLGIIFPKSILGMRLGVFSSIRSVTPLKMFLTNFTGAFVSVRDIVANLKFSLLVTQKLSFGLKILQIKIMRRT